MSSKFAAGVQFTAGHSSLARMRVEAWLSRVARTRPERAAVNALTYAQLDAAASAGARDLRARGVGPGDRGAIALPGGKDFAVALHATGRAGAAAVPLALRAPDPPLAGSSVLV